MTIEQLFTNLSISSSIESLKTLNFIFEEAAKDIEGIDFSFWGSRIIRYRGETFSFSQIAKKVQKVAETCREAAFKDEGPDEIRREQWIKMVDGLATLYGKSDAMIKNQNFLTRLFIFIRETFSHEIYSNFRKDHFGKLFSYQLRGSFACYSQKGMEELAHLVNNASSLTCLFYHSHLLPVASDNTISNRARMLKANNTL